MPIEPSQLVLNPDGSVYHLRLRPEHIADTILLVGDPDRVGQVSKHFDRIEHQIQKREFITHTGYLGNQRLSVISTGIGTDNIDIVVNELDALANIDLTTRTPIAVPRSLRLIRVGTSGCLDPEVPIDSFIASRFGLGLDGLLLYYRRQPTPDETALQESYTDYLAARQFRFPVPLYAAQGQQAWADVLQSKGFATGITITAPGFYAPQMRSLRAPLALSDFFHLTLDFRFKGLSVTNFEMETSALFGLSNLLGHKALSLNAVVAHRYHQQFSADPLGTVDKLIRAVLDWLSASE